MIQTPPRTRVRRFLLVVAICLQLMALGHGLLQAQTADAGPRTDWKGLFRDTLGVPGLGENGEIVAPRLPEDPRISPPDSVSTLPSVSRPSKTEQRAARPSTDYLRVGQQNRKPTLSPSAARPPRTARSSLVRYRILEADSPEMPELDGPIHYLDGDNEDGHSR